MIVNALSERAGSGVGVRETQGAARTAPEASWAGPPRLFLARSDPETAATDHASRRRRRARQVRSASRHLSQSNPAPPSKKSALPDNGLDGHHPPTVRVTRALTPAGGGGEELAPSSRKERSNVQGAPTCLPVRAAGSLAPLRSFARRKLREATKGEAPSRGAPFRARTPSAI